MLDSFLGTKKIRALVIYGNVDREVKNTLAKYNPEIINKEGDRFLNNIEIVKNIRNKTLEAGCPDKRGIHRTGDYVWL